MCEGFNLLKGIAREGKLLQVLHTPIPCSYQVLPGLVSAVAASLISRSLQKLKGLAPGDLIHSGILPKVMISNSGSVPLLLKGLGNIVGLAILKIAGPPFQHGRGRSAEFPPDLFAELGFLVLGLGVA
jgi:hypothetical protein